MSIPDSDGGATEYAAVADDIADDDTGRASTKTAAVPASRAPGDSQYGNVSIGLPDAAAAGTGKTSQPMTKLAAGVLSIVLIGIILIQVLMDMGPRKWGAGPDRVAVGDAVPVAKWTSFSPPDKLFQVSLPQTPRKSERMQRGRQVTEYRIDTPAFNCAVSRISGNEEMDEPLTASLGLMRIAESETIRRNGASVLGYTPLTHKGYPGIEIEMVVSEQHYTSWFIMCGKNLWTLEFSELHNQKSPAEKQRFFDSFELTVAARMAPSGVAAGTATANGPATRKGPPPRRPTGPYAERRTAHPTILVKRGPAPQSERPAPPPEGVEEVTYESGDLKLKAWLIAPAASASPVKAPALVFLHDGFALTPADVSLCRPFTEAGFAVLLPMFRGENGGPGNFELLWGEVDDARAAIRWLSRQSFVDPERIHAFGHGTGGGIAALLSLHGDIPLRDSGSANGLFSEPSLLQFHEIAPFDLADAHERRHRLLLGNTREMVRPHYAYIGEQDPLSEVLPHARLNAGTFLLAVTGVPGDAADSFESALQRYLAQCQSDNGPPADAAGRDGQEPPAPRVPKPKNSLSNAVAGAFGMAPQQLKQLRLMAEVIEKTSPDAIDPRQQYVVAAETWLKANDKTRALRVARLAEATEHGRTFSASDDSDIRIAEIYLSTGQNKSAATLIERLIQTTDDEAQRTKLEARLQKLQPKAAE